MNVSPKHISEYHDGNEVGRYGRNFEGNIDSVFVWYHDGLRSADEPVWAMDVDIEFKISISVDVLLVADATTQTVWSVDRDAFTDDTSMIDGREQYVAKASDAHVRKVGDPNDVLNGHLWIESGNQIDEGYHKQKNEA